MARVIVLGPDLFEVQADSLDHADGGVAEGQQADAAQERIVDQFGFVEDEVDQAGLGVEAEVVGQGGELVAHILMEQMARSKPNEDEQKRLQELVGCNEHQPLIVVSAPGEDVQRGADHHPRGGVNKHSASSYVK